MTPLPSRRSSLLALALLLAACSTEAPLSEPSAPPLEPASMRPARHAGSWYPADAADLRRALDSFLTAPHPAETPDSALAVIAPHAGIRYSGAVAGTVYSALGNQAVHRVFLLGPSHYRRFVGVALPAADRTGYATPLGPLPIDQRAVARLRGAPGFDGPAEAHDPEHSLELNSIFLAARWPGVRLVPLVVGRIPDDAFARELAGNLRPLLGPGDLVVVSSDFTHYGPRYNFLPFRDSVPERLVALLGLASAPLLAADLVDFNAHLARTGDTICGSEPLRLLLTLLPPGSRGQEVARDSSGRLTGDYTNSVSYLGIRYGGGSWPRVAETVRREQPDHLLDPDARRAALEVARHTLHAYLDNGRVPDAAELAVPAAGPLRETRAAFVTLKKDRRLRGCIGHVFPSVPLWQSIRDNAIAAAVRDRRFPPVSAAELAELELEVSVLTRPRWISGPEGFRVGLHGVVFSALGRRAVFLPQVAPEQGWDRSTTLANLAQKAGLTPDGWQHPDAAFQVFEAQVFGDAALRH